MGFWAGSSSTFSNSPARLSHSFPTGNPSGATAVSDHLLKQNKVGYQGWRWTDVSEGRTGKLREDSEYLAEEVIFLWWKRSRGAMGSLEQEWLNSSPCVKFSSLLEHSRHRGMKAAVEKGAHETPWLGVLSTCNLWVQVKEGWRRPAPRLSWEWLLSWCMHSGDNKHLPHPHHLPCVCFNLQRRRLKNIQHDLEAGF